MGRLKNFFWNMYIQDAKKEPVSTLVRYIPKKGIILDAGSGDGQYNSVLNSTERAIICLDIKAPKMRSRENDFIIGSIECLPFKNEVFDFLYCLSVLQFVKNDEAGFEEFRRTLKPGGRSVITVPTKYSIFQLLRELEIFLHVYEFPDFNVPLHHYYSKMRIKQLASKFFFWEVIRGYNFNFFYPRFYLLIRNLCKKIHEIPSKSGVTEENTYFDNVLIKYPKKLYQHFFRFFDIFGLFSTFFAWHYVVVLDKKNK
jgi:SAM-dependent methyltransferase